MVKAAALRNDEERPVRPPPSSAGLPPCPDAWWRHGGVLLVLLFALIGAVWHARGLYSLAGLCVVSGASAACVLFLPRRPPRAGPWWAVLILASLLSGVLVCNALWGDVLSYAALRMRKTYRLPAAVSLGMLVGYWVMRRRQSFTPLLIGSVVCYVAFMSTQLMRSPAPIIDGWVLTTEATERLLDGRYVYGHAYSDVYAAHGLPGFGYRVFLIYPPGLILHYVPAVWLGEDVRWMNLTAMAFGLLFFASWVPRPSGPGGLTHTVTAAGAVVMFWFHGGQAWALEQAWPAPWILLYLCLALWAWRRSAWVTVVAVAVGLTFKQTTWLCAPFLLALAIKERRWKLIASVAVGVGVIVGPFFFWHPAAFFRDVVLDLLQKPPRVDALSWSAVCLRHAKWLYEWAYLLGYVIYAVCLGWLAWRMRTLRREDALMETARWMTFALLGLFLFLKQSFFNYYYVSNGLLVFYVCMLGKAGGPPSIRKDLAQGAGPRG